MATQLPISTITYNSIPFLTEKLESWRSAHIIQSYVFAPHIGEDGDKNHIHLRVVPNKRLDPMDLSEDLKEYDPSHPNIPLGCMDWRFSDEGNAILYFVHDPEFMKLKYGDFPKGEKIPYELSDLHVSDGFLLEEAFLRAKAQLKYSSAKLAQRLRSGEDPYNLLLEGVSPVLLNQVFNLLSKSQFKQLVAELEHAHKVIDQLMAAIQFNGFEVVEIDDIVCLQRKDPSNFT